MQNVMVDIETLNTDPDAVVLSIGAVAFDQSPPLEKLPSFFERLILQPQLDRGCTVSADTIKWWMQQDRTAIEAAFFAGGEVPVFSAITHLVGFLSARCNFGVDQVFVWANSPSFDCTIIRNLAGTVMGSPPLWSFRNERDVRTLRAVADLESAPGPADLGYVAHHPIGDCLAQVEVVRRCYAKLGLDLDAIPS